MSNQNESRLTVQPLDAEPEDWLAELVTEEAKKNPNWRAKALTGHMLIGEADAEAAPQQLPN